MIDRSGTVGFSLAVYVTITIRLLFDSGLIRLFNDHVNSNMVSLLDNKIYPIMRNQITHLVFSTILFLHVHPLIWFILVLYVMWGFLIVSFLACQNWSGHVNRPTDNLNALIDTFHSNGAHISSGVSRSDSRLELSSFCTFWGAAFSHLFSHLDFFLNLSVL